MGITSKRPMQQMLFMCLGSVLLVGVTQEAIQMFSVGVFNIGASLFDLGIDLAGGAIPLLVHKIISVLRVKQLE